MKDLICAARPLAPEDVRPGMFVMTFVEIAEFHCPVCVDGRVVVTRSERTPEECSTLMRVRSVCLPYVLVEGPSGGAWFEDLRRTRFAKVPARFAWDAAKRIARN